MHRALFQCFTAEVQFYSHRRGSCLQTISYPPFTDARAGTSAPHKTRSRLWVQLHLKAQNLFPTLSNFLASMLVEDFTIDSKNVRREGDVLVSSYDYKTTEVDRAADGEWTVRPVSTNYEFRTDTRVPKLGCEISAKKVILMFGTQQHDHYKSSIGDLPVRATDLDMVDLRMQ